MFQTSFLFQPLKKLNKSCGFP